MTKKYSGIFILALALLAGSLGCSSRQVLREPWLETHLSDTIAVADSGVALTTGQLYDYISPKLVMTAGGVTSPQMTRDLIDSLLLDTLAGLAANEIRLDEHYLQQKLFKQQYYDFLVDRYWRETVYKHITGDSLEAIRFYDANKELFTVKEQVDLYHILASPTGLLAGPESSYYKTVSRDELWTATKEYADRLHQLLDWGEPFENVAFEFSHDVSSRDHGGKMGWTARGTYLHPFDSVAFSLKPGEYSDPYRDKDGWHIVYVNAYLPEGPAPIDSPQVYESAFETLITAKTNHEIEKRLDSLRQEIHVDVNQVVLDTNLYFVDDTVWTGVVNGKDTIDCRDLRELEEEFRHKYRVENTTGDMKREMLRAIALRYVQIQAARTLGIDTLPDVVAERNRLRHLRSKWIIKQQQYDLKWQPSEEMMRTYYDRHASMYITRRPYVIEVITTPDSEFARYLHDQVESGLGMEQVYEDNHDAAVPAVTYDKPREIGQGDVSAELYTLAARTPAGELSHIIRNKRGQYQFLWMVSRNESRPYELARGEIRRILQKRHATGFWHDFRDRLYSRYHVRFRNRPAGIELKSYAERNPIR